MTIREILRALEPRKPMTATALYTHLRALKIKPMGARQIPQRYPDDTAKRILIHLGFRKRARRLSHSTQLRRAA